MRVYDVVMRSGVKNEITAEAMHDDPEQDNKIYFYRDKAHTQLIAYFIRDEVAGIILGPDKPGGIRRYK